MDRVVCADSELTEKFAGVITMCILKFKTYRTPWWHGDAYTVHGIHNR